MLKQSDQMSSGEGTIVAETDAVEFAARAKSRKAKAVADREKAERLEKMAGEAGLKAKEFIAVAKAMSSMPEQ